MAIVVEHDKRKHEILQKSLDIFVEEGYEDVTFQKIADRCGITRTTLYIYFKNKHEIFLGSIKELLSKLDQSITIIMNDTDLSAEEALRRVLMKIIDQCEESKQLFSVILNYLLQIKKTGVDTSEKVRRRVLKLRHVLSTLLIRGIKNKEFKKIDVKKMNEILYGQLEASIFRLVILNQDNVQNVRDSLNLTVDFFLA